MALTSAAQLGKQAGCQQAPVRSKWTCPIAAQAPRTHRRHQPQSSDFETSGQCGVPRPRIACPALPPSQEWFHSEQAQQGPGSSFGLRCSERQMQQWPQNSRTGLHRASLVLARCVASSSDSHHAADACADGTSYNGNGNGVASSNGNGSGAHSNGVVHSAAGGKHSMPSTANGNGWLANPSAAVNTESPGPPRPAQSPLQPSSPQAATHSSLPKQPLSAAAAASNFSSNSVLSSTSKSSSPKLPGHSQGSSSSSSSSSLEELEQVPESGVLPEQALKVLGPKSAASSSSPLRAGSKGASTSPPTASTTTAASAATVTASAGTATAGAAAAPLFAYPPAERSQIRESWDALMRWSKVFRTRKDMGSPLELTRKIAVFGGGSFGTAIAASLASQKEDLEVVLLLRDPYLARDINTLHCNTRYLKDYKLPPNVRATTSATEAIHGAQYAVHAVPVQSSRAFLVGIKDLLPPDVPIICVSKGLEVGTGLMMSELVPSALERKQPAVFLSGPSFAKEVMENRPTGLVAASKDAELARTVQALFASRAMRVNTTSDVVGVEICGALKNVLAIAAGIVEGLELGNNAMAALIAQGCSEIRWLAERLGAKPTTMSGLSGLGDIMLTCYGNLSRNRSVGIRLGRGEKLEDILASSPQVAEGVATAGVVVSLARKYRVSLPVLTAVAQVLDNALTPEEAVMHIMCLPQIEEK